MGLVPSPKSHHYDTEIGVNANQMPSAGQESAVQLDLCQLVSGHSLPALWDNRGFLQWVCFKHLIAKRSTLQRALWFVFPLTPGTSQEGYAWEGTCCGATRHSGAYPTTAVPSQSQKDQSTCWCSTTCAIIGNHIAHALHLVAHY